MDPVSAIGLASAILTFIDAAFKVVSGTYEVYESSSGATAENEHIDTIVGDLQDLTSDLSTINVGKTRNEIALKALASKCEVVSNDLQHLFSSLRLSGAHSTWSSLKVKIKSMRKEKEIAGMEKQLSDYRAQILARLNLMLSQQQSSVKQQLDKLEKTTTHLSAESTAQLSRHRHDVIDSINRLQVETYQGFATSANKAEEATSEVLQALKALSLKMEAVPRENIILRNIFFPSMNMREESIHDPESGTLRWVLEDAKTDTVEVDEEEVKNEYWKDREARLRRREELDRRAHSRRIFLTWLRTGRGVFHISGKTGSGKSTLMKFLSDHHRTREELGEWASSEGKTLAFARFYFWSSGDDIQKSLAGLHRTILFETLKRCPELIPRVFPRHWDQLAGTSTYVPGDSFSASDFKMAFDTLTDHGAFSRYRFCFFIDGLDEFQGRSEDHVQLAKSLQRWSSNGDVKICASSRPYLEFDDLASKAGQKFYLHELTRHDIHLFSRQMIEKSDNFDQVKTSYMRLVDQIVDRSEGVFLWARLVVSSLLAGMLRHDTTDALERKLEMIPKDINRLYDSLLDALEPDDQERAAKLLITAANCSSHNGLPLHCRAYGWVDKFDDPDFPPCDGRKPPLWRAESAMFEAIQRQLKGLTKGLLDIEYCTLNDEASIQAPVVGFFHRTVKDFVMNSVIIREIYRNHPGLLETEWHLRLLLADLSLATPEYRKSYWDFRRVTGLSSSFSMKQLPVTILTGFRHILDACQGLSGNWNSRFGYWPRGQLSFTHFAAYTGQIEYVLREIQTQPELLRGHENKHLLISAAAGRQEGLVTALLERGASPMDQVLSRPRIEDEKRILVPIWLAVSIFNIGSYMRFGPIYTKFDILESLLSSDGVKVQDFVVLLGRRGDTAGKITHFTTLKEFIQDLGPNNKDRLLSLINSEKPLSLFASIRRLAWQASGLFKESQDTTLLDASAYTRYRARQSQFPGDFKVIGYVWGDITLEDPAFEIY